MAGMTVWRTILRKALLEIQSREYARALSPHRIQGPRINTQGPEDGRCYLGRAHLGFYGLAVEIRMGEQQHNVGIVMGKTTVLSLLFVAAEVRNSDVRGHDDVRRAWVLGRVVVVQLQR